MRISWKFNVRLAAVTLCLIMLGCLLLPAVSVQAAESQSYSFHLLGELYTIEPGNTKYLFDQNWTFEGSDIDFYSAYMYYYDSGQSKYVAFCVQCIAISEAPFTMTKDGVTFSSNNLQSTVINGKTVYYYRTGVMGTAERDGFMTYTGFPNMHYIEYEGPATGVTDFANSIFDEVLQEYVENGGIDWELDTSAFDGFYLTGFSVVENPDDFEFTISWIGTSIGDALQSVSNDSVRAFVYTADGEVVDVGLSTIKSGSIVVAPYIDLDFGFAHAGSGWNSKIYLVPSFEYMGHKYEGAYAVFDTKTMNIYNVLPDSGQTYTLNDFYLSNVNLTKEAVISAFGYYKISWRGTTRSADLMFVPDSDTLVTASIVLEDQYGNYINQELATTTIGKGYFRFDMDKLLDQGSQTAYYWDGMIYLMPSFTRNADLYMGQFTVVDTLTGAIYQDILDEDDETVHRDPVSGGSSGSSGGNSFGVSSMTDYVNTGFGFLSDLIAMMSGFPALVAAVFQFIPSIYIDAIAVMLIIIFVARILGR